MTQAQGQFLWMAAMLVAACAVGAWFFIRRSQGRVRPSDAGKDPARPKNLRSPLVARQWLQGFGALVWILLLALLLVGLRLFIGGAPH